MSPAHAIDWVSRFPNQAMMKIGTSLADANNSVKAVAPAQFAAWEHNVPSNNATIGQLKEKIKAKGPGA